MRTAASRRIPFAIAWGALGVVAWAAFTILASGGSAHAEEEPDRPLDGLTSLVGSTVGAGADLAADVLTETVSPVVETVAPVVPQTAPDVVEPVMTAPVAAEVVQPAIAPVTQVAAETTASITTPATELLHDAPLTSITSPVLEVVSDVPIVGDALDELAIPDAVTAVVHAVDVTTGVLGQTVEDTVPPVLDVIHPPAAPTAPTEAGVALPGESDDRPLPGPVETEAIIAAGTAAAASDFTPFAHRTFDSALADFVVSAAGSSDPAVPSRAAHAPPGSTAPSSSAAHSGGHVGDGARLDDASADSLHAWQQALPTIDDELPSSPVEDTDASPD